MLSGWLLALLAATPAEEVQKAHALAQAHSWEELYLAFSSAKPEPFSGAQRARVASDLQRGCQALLASDPVMAYSLGERARAFSPTAEGVLCLAKAAQATDQRAASEQALREGLKRFPQQGALALALGEQLLEEKDAAGAAAALKSVPRKSKEYPRAQKLLQGAAAAAREEEVARRETRAVEARIDQGAPATPQPRGARAQATGKTVPASLTYESGEQGGMRTRGNSRFVLKYFNHDRDFGQRAEYEGQVVAALDEAYDFTQSFLGEARAAPCDVILYTRQEFAAHYSEGAAQRVAGLYMMNAIRMNDAAELNPQNRATLVHEYVHAVVDDLAKGESMRLPHWFNEGLAEYIEWRYEGSEDPPAYQGGAMRQAAKAARLPTLQEMDRGAPINQRNPAIGYGVSAVAVRTMLKTGGPANLVSLIREVAGGAPFEQVFERRYGKDLNQLQADVHEELAGR